jgi:hypothetical protein
VIRSFYHVNTINNSTLASQLILFSAKTVDAINIVDNNLNVNIIATNYVISMNKQYKIKLGMMTINVCNLAQDQENAVTNVSKSVSNAKMESLNSIKMFVVIL